MKKIRKILPLVGILILIYVISKVGLDNLVDTFRIIKWDYIFLSILVGVLIVILQAWKWDLIIKRQGINLPFLYILKVQLISVFYGNITPGRIGSFIKVAYLKEKTNKELGKCISSVTLERFYDLFIVALFAFLGSIVALEFFSGIFWEFLIIFIISLVGLVLSINKRAKEFFISLAFKFLVPKKFKDRTRDAFNSFHDSLLKPSQILMPIIATLIVWIGIYLQIYVVALALSLDVPVIKFMFVSAIGTMVSLIPITVGGIGTTEASLTVLYYKIFQIQPSLALSLVLINRIIGLLITLFGGVMSMKEERYF